MRRQFRFINAARYGSGYNGGGVFVSYVVLHHENGAYAALFAADDGGKIGVIKFTAFYVHRYTSCVRKTPYDIICRNSVFPCAVRIIPGPLPFYTVFVKESASEAGKRKKFPSGGIPDGKNS
jgi:hypothetical protein